MSTFWHEHENGRGSWQPTQSGMPHSVQRCAKIMMGLMQLRSCLLASRELLGLCGNLQEGRKTPRPNCTHRLICASPRHMNLYVRMTGNKSGRLRVPFTCTVSPMRQGLAAQSLRLAGDICTLVHNQQTGQITKTMSPQAVTRQLGTHVSAEDRNKSPQWWWEVLGSQGAGSLLYPFPTIRNLAFGRPRLFPSDRTAS